mgnify:CR=1 FL=1
MSAYQQIRSTAENAIQELETEIIDLEEKIEAHKLRIQHARVQIQSLNSFLNPEESSYNAPKPVKLTKKNGKANAEGLDLQ